MNELNRIRKEIKFSFSGITSHAAAAPDYGRSAFDSLLLTISALERTQKHLPTSVTVEYKILSSGNVAPNVIPDFAEGLLIITAETQDEMMWICARTKEIIDGAAQMTGTGATIAGI